MFSSATEEWKHLKSTDDYVQNLDKLTCVAHKDPGVFFRV